MTAAIAVRVRARSLKNAKLRLDAGLRYICDPNGLSLEELHQESQFAVVSIATIERWCKRDQWVEQRTRWLEEWARKARERLGTRMAQDRISELQLVDEIANSGLKKIRDDVVAPRSLEGVMKATVDAYKWKDELRRRIGEEIIEKTVQEAAAASDVAKGLPRDAHLELTEEDAALAARAALVAKRESRRRGLPAGTPSPVEVASKDAVVQPGVGAQVGGVPPGPPTVVQRSDPDPGLPSPDGPPAAGGAGRSGETGEVEDAVADVEAQLPSLYRG